MLRQLHKPFRRGRQGLGDRSKEPNPNGELDNKGPKTADGVYAVLLVYPHRLGGELLPVFGMPVLDFLQLGLEVGHTL